MKKCDFCNNRIVKRQIFKNRFFPVILSNMPIVPGHLLVLPIRHIQKADDLSLLERQDFFSLVKALKQLLTKTFKAVSFNFAWNEGQTAGQSVEHLHIHIVPRKSGDAGVKQQDPRKFLYRPGPRKLAANADLENLTILLKRNIKSLN